MAISTADKQVILEGLKKLDVQAMYASADEDKRKWFRFGAFDAIQRVSALIESYPDDGQKPDEPNRPQRITVVQS